MEDEAEALYALRWSWRLLLAIIVHFFADVAVDVSNAVRDVEKLIVCSELYRDEKRAMHEQGALEIEALTKGE